MEILNATREIVVPDLLDEKRYAQEMTEIVEPYLDSIRQKGRLSEKLNLYYELYLLEEAKGTIVICHGYTECTGKYQELIYYFLKNGYQTAVYDQRGHGRSLREVDDRGIVHVENFDAYVADLHTFLHKIVLKHMHVERKHLYLYGHSMGGCVSARYLETYPNDFTKAVLTAPMMGLAMPRAAVTACRVICGVKIAQGKGKERIFNQGPFNPNETYEECSASSRARFEYYHRHRVEIFDYQVGGASYSWGRQAIRAGRKATKQSEIEKIKTPLIMFMAGQDNLVDADAQKRFLKHLKCGYGVLVPESRHEIYRAGNGILGPYLKKIFEFYEG